MTNRNDSTGKLSNRSQLTSQHRLRGFDYRNPGYYFITTCINYRRPLLGQLHGGRVLLSGAGTMVAEVIEAVPIAYPGIELDCYVVMPNHVHALIYLPLNGPNASLSDIVRWIKGVSTSRYGLGVKEHGWPPYDRRFWQKGFNDQILRNDLHLAEVRRYIEENPVNWDQDELS